MFRATFAFVLLGIFAGSAALAAPVPKKTVCTITVNSADEKDTFRARLPKGKYEFVELVEKGRPDWLRSSCTRNVQCDVLVISGHFNAGDTFYSDRLDRNEFLEIDELERASCSASCPNLFSRLKEVYLFGCESLNPDSRRYASSHGESGRERMRRIFQNVPSIYGFSASAPVGSTAGTLLNRYFDGGGGAGFGTGRASAGLLKVFGGNSMVRVPGVGPSEPLAAERRQICRFFDEQDAGQKVRFMHGLLRENAAAAEAHFSRIEKAFASFTDADRGSPAFSQALAEVSADDAARAGYLASSRAQADPALRSRMISLARTLGWLSPEEDREETIAMVNDMLARNAVGFAEVDLVCSLNPDGALDRAAQRVSLPASGSQRAGRAAVMACLGSDEARGEMLRALASANEKDVQVAQAYFRHRPIEQPEELRALAREIARMPGGSAAQVRALDTLGRLHISDRQVLDDLSRAFAETKSVQVQRAIAEVFIRSDPKALPRAHLAGVLREHRLKPPGGGQDLVDVLLARLQSAG
jgi:hypothetical protein